MKKIFTLFIAVTFSGLTLYFTIIAGIEFESANYSTYSRFFYITCATVSGMISALAFYFLTSIQKPFSNFKDLTIAEFKEQLITDIKRIWITNFLNNMLYYNYEENMLSLPLSIKVGSYFNPASANLKKTEKISSGDDIINMFDISRDRLLILGEKGSGKTTILLKLAKDIFDRIENNQNLCVPLILTLNSWGFEKLSIEEWVVKELRIKYGIHEKAGRELIVCKHIILFLDGLDELAPDDIVDCIESINEYISQDRALVITATTESYDKQSLKLFVNTEVDVLPLSSEQVIGYLDNIEKREDIDGLRYALSKSEALRNLVKAPFFLIVAISAYIGKSKKDVDVLIKAKLEEQPSLILFNFIEQMLKRKADRLKTSKETTKKWLEWLAFQMTVHNQNEFYLENLQPSWLTKKKQNIYRISASAIYGLSLGSIIWITFGISLEFIFGIVSNNVNFLGIIIGVIFGILFGLDFGYKSWLSSEKINPVEIVAWSWSKIKSTKNRIILEFILYLFIGLGVVFFFGFSVRSFIVSYGVVITLFLSDILEIGKINLQPRPFTSFPNERIQYSRKNGLRYGLILWLIFGLIFGLGMGIGVGLGIGIGYHYGLIFGLIFGLSSGLFFGLYHGLYTFGLAEVFNHYILRYWLWKNSIFPIKTLSFLEDATDQQLLRRVGGGFMFRHSYLKKYFYEQWVLHMNSKDYR